MKLFFVTCVLVLQWYRCCNEQAHVTAAWYFYFFHQSHLLIAVGQVLLSSANYLCVLWHCSHKLIVASWVCSLGEDE